ncbi:(2Fe-2S)-binding protein [Jatrophihabitans sp. YIM 134969]
MTKPAEQIAVDTAVNGRRYRRTVMARMSLADFLREELTLTGTKLGCEHGVCGSCTVLVDNELARACLMLAAQADGRDIRTVESLADGREMTPLQKSFQKHHALQCGFCTAGFLMSSTALLEQGKPSRQDVVDTLSGHYCRCTGYAPIIDAVVEVAEGQS